MEIKTKKIKMKSPKSQSKSMDKYKEFLGEKKNIKKSKDKKVFHITRKRISPKKIKKIDPKDLLQIEKNIADIKSKSKSQSIHMPTQNENLTQELNKSVQDLNIKPVKPAVKPIVKSVKPVKPAVKPIVKHVKPVKPIVKPIVKSVKPINRSTIRPVSRKTTRSKKTNRKVSIKTGTFNNKEIKKVESKIKEIRKKKTEDIKKELESQGVKVSGKSNRLIRDIYLYSKISNINIKHEV